MTLELLALIIASITAIGSFTWNLVQARDTVRGREFDMLIKTLDAVGKRLDWAEKRIDELEAENQDLRERVAELETENRELREGRPA